MIFGKMVNVSVWEYAVFNELNFATVQCELWVVDPPIPQIVVICFVRFNPSC